jgi:HK97 family phage portal protein
MSWYNPASWRKAKSSELTLDQLITRMNLRGATAADVPITPETALNAPTVFAIVAALSRAVAAMPFLLTRDDSEEGKRHVVALPDHNIVRLLRFRPNAWQSPYNYWSLVMVRLLLYGKFYARKLQSANGTITSLQPLDPAAVREEQLDSGRLIFHVTTANGQATLTQEQMHWITSLSFDGINGMTPVQKCKDAIALEIAAERYGAQIFGSGAIPNVLLEHPGHFKDDDARDRFKESWNAAFRKKRGTAVLEDGLKAQIMQLNNEESQFLETRKLQRAIIAGAFGVPPHVIGDLERATFSNIESLSLFYINQSLTPYLACIEGAVERDLLTQVEVRRGVRAQFDTTAMLRGDAKSRAEALRIQRQWGIINANEWRAREGLDAREDEDGDDFIVPMNFTAQEEEKEEPKPAVDPDEVDPEKTAFKIPTG